jgi:molybdopterin-guanine dinucleotide biosynthesis protein A
MFDQSPPTIPSEIDGFILVGGASKRMGRDKAKLKLGALNFIERIARAMAPVTRDLRLVSSRARSGPWPLPTVYDLYPDCGALGGIHAALSASRSPWTLIVACDLPFITTEFLALLVQARSASEAIVPIQADGRAQPLCALYKSQPCLKRASALLRSGERRVGALLERIDVRYIASEEYAHLPGAERLLFNVNSPTDYARASALEQAS